MYYSGFFDGDTEYGQEELNRYFDNIYASGVSIDDSGNMTLAVTSSGSGLSVAPGFAILKGFWFFAGETNSLQITPDANYSRTDRVVLRLDLASSTVQLALKTGAASGTPVPPELTRSESVYEISLAQVTITKAGVVTITDERFNTEVCGAIRPKNLTEYKDMIAEFERQFDAWMNERMITQTWRTVYVQAAEPTGTITRGSIWIQEL